jgi:hypothetical protein
MSLRFLEQFRSNSNQTGPVDPYHEQLGPHPGLRDPFQLSNSRRPSANQLGAESR